MQKTLRVSYVCVCLRDGSSVPKATWCVSQEYLRKSIDANDVPTVQNAKGKHHWPRANNIYVCTHDYAAERCPGSYFDVVVLDEIGALDLYKGCCLLGLARCMGKLMGDPPSRKPSMCHARGQTRTKCVEFQDAFISMPTEGHGHCTTSLPRQVW